MDFELYHTREDAHAQRNPIQLTPEERAALSHIRTIHIIGPPYCEPWYRRLRAWLKRSADACGA